MSKLSLAPVVACAALAVMLITQTAAAGQAQPPTAYTRSLARVEAAASAYLTRARRSGEKQAIVLDVDDTTLLTYRVSHALVRAGDERAVPGMPALVNRAAREGYEVFWITARPLSLRAATARNLAAAGYKAPTDDGHLFLKSAAPTYLSCRPTCTTEGYKEETRSHLASLGFTIVANFGDQATDLAGGHALRTFRMPRP